MLKPDWIKLTLPLNSASDPTLSKMMKNIDK
jgi:hypothetical protein